MSRTVERCLGLSPTQIERFWAKVRRVEGDGCWLWTARLDQDGYGLWQPSQGRPAMRAHRVSFSLTFGDLPDGVLVCHDCDNPPCVRPGHLFPGTNVENVADRVAKGRSARGHRSGRYTRPERTARGERNGRAKLTEAAVAEIRCRCAGGEGYRPLGREFGVTHRVVRLIARGELWSEPVLFLGGE